MLDPRADITGQDNTRALLEIIVGYTQREPAHWDLFLASREALHCLQRLEEEQELPEGLVAALEVAVRNFSPNHQ